MAYVGIAAPLMLDGFMQQVPGKDGIVMLNALSVSLTPRIPNSHTVARSNVLVLVKVKVILGG